MSEFAVVTGMSGAGRSTAAAALEDVGWFVIDNLPAGLIMKMVEMVDRPGSGIERVALVIGRGGSNTGPEYFDDLPDVLDELRSTRKRVRVIFLDAPDEVLIRRYEGTRRRHPLAARGVEESIADERKLLEPVRERADLMIDTGELNSNQLRSRILEAFGDDEEQLMQTSVVSFGYKHGIPLDVDLVFDCRFLPNPFWVEELRPFSGLDEPVREYVLSQPESLSFLEKVDDLLTSILPAFVREGKSYLTIAMGCTGGRHRSVALAQALADRLAGHGQAGLRLPPGHRQVSEVRPAVVAIGGGHGTAVTLKAARRYAGSLTGVVSVADDGGSSGRLRELLNVVALGDLRKCLVALADEDSALALAFERRFEEGELAGHALGNLILTGLIDATGDLVLGVREAAQLLGRTARSCRPPRSRSRSRPNRLRARWPARWRSWVRATSDRSRWCPTTLRRLPWLSSGSPRRTRS